MPTNIEEYIFKIAFDMKNCEICIKWLTKEGGRKIAFHMKNCEICIKWLTKEGGRPDRPNCFELQTIENEAMSFKDTKTII